MNGGYVMIDCEGLDLGNPGKVDGLYTRAKNALATNKPVQLYNVKNGTQEFTPIPAFGGVESATSVFLSFVPVTIHIDNTDTVTI